MFKEMIIFCGDDKSARKKKINFSESMDDYDSTYNLWSINDEYQSSNKVSTNNNHRSTHKKSTASVYKVGKLKKIW